MFDTQLHLLAVQEVHDGLQDVVGLLDHAAIGRHGLPFDLGQDVSHLPHVVLDLGLETTSPHKKNNIKIGPELSCRDGRSTSYFHTGIKHTPTWQRKCGWGRPWRCWVCSAAPWGSRWPPRWAGRRHNGVNTGAMSCLSNHNNKCMNGHSRLFLPWPQTSSPAELWAAGCYWWWYMAEGRQRKIITHTLLTPLPLSAPSVLL